MSDHFAVLRDVYFFRDLEDQDVRSLAAYCVQTRFVAGDIIFRERSPGDRFYIVISGEVEVWRDFDLDGRDLLAIHGAGHLFGEMALVDDLPRSATVVARTATTLLYLSREHFHDVLKRSTTVALSILKSLSAMVRSSNDSFVTSLARQNEALQKACADLKEAQNELIRSERLSNIGKFSSMILHDIRNPISAVRGYAELILSRPEDPERVEKYASSVLQEADRLQQLAGELLDYSRGDIRLNVRLVEIGAFLDRFCEFTLDRFESRGMTLIVENECPEPVVFDDQRMMRVFINVAENARKAMSKGGKLTVTARCRSNRIVFEMSDTGEGMSQQVLGQVFEPFFSSSSGGGTGLGLVIVKNVVEAHKGTLSLKSEVGKGTTVSIALPIT